MPEGFSWIMGEDVVKDGDIKENEVVEIEADKKILSNVI